MRLSLTPTALLLLELARAASGDATAWDRAWAHLHRADVAACAETLVASARDLPEPPPRAAERVFYWAAERLVGRDTDAALAIFDRFSDAGGAGETKALERSIEVRSADRRHAEALARFERLASDRLLACPCSAKWMTFLSAAESALALGRREEAHRIVENVPLSGLDSEEIPRLRRLLYATATPTR